MEIAFVLYSDLDSGNGGVETWLKLFLAEIEQRQSAYPNIGKIHIYYFTNGAPVNLIGADYAFTQLHPVNVPGKSRGLVGNFITYFKFHFQALKDLKKNHEAVQYLISIGSYPTGIFNWFILKFLIRSRVQHIIWLRTTLTKFLKTLNSKGFSKSIFALERQALNGADIIISNGWDTRNNYLADYDINSVVIPNAINLEKYQQAAALKDIRGTIKIAFVGRFFANKGVFNFVKAIQIFNNSFPDLAELVNFVFVGWGETEVEQFAINTDNCTYTGKVSNADIAGLLDQIHCGMALTKFNDQDPGGSGVSNGLLELMASGKIIIAYDNQIYRQFPGAEFMVYIKENDDEALAQSFADIVTSREEYFKRGEQAREYVGAFSIENHVASFSKLLVSDSV